MKKISILLFTICTFSLYAQLTYVPDDNFEQWLIYLGYDDVFDDYVLTANINTITSLDVNSRGINDLTGIEDFTALIELRCWENQLTNLDVSQNTALTYLDCHRNQLSNLNVSQNTVLTILWCDMNQLTNLNVSQNTNLTVLSCHSTQLTNLDVSQNTALTFLGCYLNELTSLDVSQNTALIELRCWENQLTNLDVSHNTDLTTLACGKNQLTNLDVSQNLALTRLYCDVNQLNNLDVSQNTVLSALWCHSNQLTNIDLSQNTVLSDLWCYSNQLSNIDLSQHTALARLLCQDNQLTNLNIRNGNNINFFGFNAIDNPNLACVFVDNATYSSQNWYWVDPNSTFVETQAECDALGIDGAIFTQSINIFPNPTTGIITIETFDVEAINNIYVSDILGQRIIDNQKSKQIDISDFSNGIYFLNIESKTGNKAVYKVIKE